MALTVKINGDASHLDKTLKGVDKKVGGLASGIKKIGAAVAGVFVAQAGFSAISGALQKSFGFIDDLYDAAGGLRTLPSNLAEIDWMLGQIGAEGLDASKALTTLSVAMGDAIKDKDGDARQYFNELGINLGEVVARGDDVVGMFYDVISKARGSGKSLSELNKIFAGLFGGRMGFKFMRFDEGMISRAKAAVAPFQSFINGKGGEGIADLMDRIAAFQMTMKLTMGQAMSAFIGPMNTLMTRLQSYDWGGTAKAFADTFDRILSNKKGIWAGIKEELKPQIKELAELFARTMAEAFKQEFPILAKFAGVKGAAEGSLDKTMAKSGTDWGLTGLAAGMGALASPGGAVISAPLIGTWKAVEAIYEYIKSQPPRPTTF